MKGILYAIALACAIYAGAGDLFAATPVYRDYSVTVAQGDTLWDIACRFYGDGTKWRAIAAKNGVPDPRKLQVGKVLTL